MGTTQWMVKPEDVQVGDEIQGVWWWQSLRPKAKYEYEDQAHRQMFVTDVSVAVGNEPRIIEIRHGDDETNDGAFYLIKDKDYLVIVEDD